MTDLDVIERAAAILGATVTRPSVRDPNWKQTYRVYISGYRAVRLMTILRPLMGQRRQRQIDAALSASGPLRQLLTDHQRKEIARRFQAGERAVTLAQEYGVTNRNIYKVIEKVA